MSRYRQSMREALQEVVSDNETFDEAMKWEVKISGLPTFYSDGKSRGQVRQALRKMLKRPDDIQSIERTTPAALKKIRRDQAKGEGEDVKKEEVEDAFDYKAKKGAIAAPGSGSIAKAKKAKASDVNKSIEQQMKDALKEHIKDSIKEKSGVDADGVVNMIQFGHPFKVVDEEIPPELPGPETRRYANVSNAVVDKADKKSNKAMAKAQKDTLVPTQTKEGTSVKNWTKNLPDKKTGAAKNVMAAPPGNRLPYGAALKGKSKIPNTPVSEQEGGVTDDSGYTRYPSTGNWAGIKGKTYKKNLEIAKAKIKAQVRDKKNQNKDPVGKQHEDVEIDELSDAARMQMKAHYKSRAGTDKTRERERIITAKANAAKRGPHVAKAIEKEEVEVDELLKWKVDVKGNPPAYMDGKSAAAVRQRERRIVKRPKDIGSVTRVTPAEYRKTLRQAAAGKVDLTRVPEETEWASEKRKEKESSDRLLKIHQDREARYQMQQRKKREADAKKKVSEVAPPGWGHTKAEKEKTKPNKPKSKIGGSAHEFKKDLDSGKFKGLPGDKTYKDKKASMFKLMWSMKNKGDKPHYKPGVKDQLKKKYKDESVLDSAKRYVINEKADWNTAFKSAAQSRPPMKYKDAVSFIDTAGLNSTEKRSALKAAKKWLR